MNDPSCIQYDKSEFSFEEPKQGGGPRNFRGGGSPSPRPAYGQNNRTHELPYNRGVGQNNGNSGRRDNYRSSFQNGPAPNGQPRCNKCGLAPHSNPLYCRAVNQQCNYCGKYGQYKRVCRLAKRIWHRRESSPGRQRRGRTTAQVNDGKQGNQYITLKIKRRTVQCLVDTGSSKSIISANLSKTLKLRLHQDQDGITPLVAATGHNLKIKGKTDITLQINGLLVPHTFLIVDGLYPSLVLGTDFLTKNSAFIDLGMLTVRSSWASIPQCDIGLRSQYRLRQLACRGNHFIIIISTMLRWDD